MANRLANEKSLYLRQHADNPVDWWPWCEAAFAQARAQDKPVLVSIGYSSCHWCHVMAHESFEDAYIAGLMNEHFICIKVDREERPDIDQIYMEAVQMINHHGGWPLNAFLMPDGKPFFGGTYFPAKDRGHGITPWPQLLMRISDHYKRNKAELEENADNILKNMAHTNEPMGADGTGLSNETLVQAAHAICQTHDDEWGGFGEAPKFPPSMTLNFLLAIRATQTCESNPTFASRIDQVIQTTLQGMAHGGIFDQIGGGFARYSVDKYWVIPHFEKMLYDNGLLLDIYTKAYHRYQNPLYEDIVAETVDWLSRDMLDSNGLFYASIDADSEGQEGKYYVWRPEQIEAILGEKDSQTFCDLYGVASKGNFEDGTTLPILVYNEIDKRRAAKPLRQKLLHAREKRVAPGKDLKQLVAWNSLIIRGMAEAGFTFNRPEWFDTARAAADRIWEHLRTADNRLLSVNYAGVPQLNAYLDDYAFYIESLLKIASKIDWLHPGTSQLYVQRAQQLMDVVLQHFADPHAVGCFFTSDDHEELITRKKDWFDNAIPSGNSSLVHACSELYALTGDERYAHEMQSQRQAYPGIASRVPNAISHALAGYTADAMGIAVIKVAGIKDLNPLRQALASKPWRKLFIQTVNDTDQPQGYQLCVGTQCQQPTSDLNTLIEWI